jgi:hypothetical protein
MQRPASCRRQESFHQRRIRGTAGDHSNALGLITKFAPVEAIVWEWMDGRTARRRSAHVVDHLPGQRRLPAKLDGVKQMPQIDDIIGLLADASKGGTFTIPPSLGALFAAFQGGKKDSYTEFMPSERCLFDAFVPMVPQLDDNNVQIVQGPDSVVLISDFWRRVITLDNKPFQPKRSGRGQVCRAALGGRHARGRDAQLQRPSAELVRHRQRARQGGDRADYRTGPTTLDYSATVVDPKSFKDRIELSFRWR